MASYAGRARMKIGIVGPGALGCFYAVRLAKDRDNEVFLIDKDPKRARGLDRRGIRISGLTNMTAPAASVKVVSDARRAGICDVVLVLVKAYDTTAAARRARPCVGPDTVVVTLQNGFGNIAEIRKALPRKFAGNVTGGITSNGVTLLGLGWVRHAGKGYTIIGFDPDRTGRQKRKVRELAAALNAAGIRTSVKRGTDNLIWSKVVLNSAINPLAALLRVPNGALVKLGWARRTICAIAEESAKVVRSSGRRLTFPSPRRKVVEVCNLTEVNINSMLQDILAGKKTEVDAINGAIVRRAERLGMRAPLNVACWRIVRSIEAS